MRMHADRRSGTLFGEREETPDLRKMCKGYGRQESKGGNVVSQRKWLCVMVVMAGVAAGSVLTTAQTSSVVYEARSAKLVADGKTDDSTALENAIANAIAGNYGTIQLPCGQIMVLKAINLTNRSNLTLQGCGSNLDYGGQYPKTATQILCNTGTVCLDTTGSSRVTLKDFAMRVSRKKSSPPTVALLLGRDNAGGGEK